MLFKIEEKMLFQTEETMKAEDIEKIEFEECSINEVLYIVIFLRLPRMLSIKIMRFADFLRVQIHSWNANVSGCSSP